MSARNDRPSSTPARQVDASASTERTGFAPQPAPAGARKISAQNPPAVWCQTLHGHALDLLAPDPRMLDFREIAEQLAAIARFAGAARSRFGAVSVAFHTLLAAHEAPPSLKPYMLVHDAHEFAIGDIPTPAARALARIADADGGGAPRGWIVADALGRLKDGLDRAIWSAAGLAPPDERQRAAIRFHDIKALVTERRDFCAPPPYSWGPEIEAVAPSARVWRGDEFGRTPLDVADSLWRAFQTHLPSLGGGLPAPAPQPDPSPSPSPSPAALEKA